MNKKCLAIVLVVASSFASSAFATSIINKLITKHSSTTHSIVKTHKTTKQDGSYTDFTGKWVGNCGDGEDVTADIENGIDYISFGGDVARIGLGLQGTYDSNEADSMYDHTSFEWNKDGSLARKGVFVVKDNMDNSAIQTIMSTFTLTMKNGQINLDGKAVGFEDLTQMQQAMTVHCVFSKKQ